MKRSVQHHEWRDRTAYRLPTKVISIIAAIVGHSLSTITKSLEACFALTAATAYAAVANPGSHRKDDLD